MVRKGSSVRVRLRASLGTPAAVGVLAFRDRGSGCLICPWGNGWGHTPGANVRRDVHARLRERGLVRRSHRHLYMGDTTFCWQLTDAGFELPVERVLFKPKRRAS